MKEHHTNDYQNGKFFTVMDHVVAKYRHPAADAALKQALIQNKPKEKVHAAADRSGAGDSPEPIILGDGSAKGNPVGPIIDGAIGSNPAGASD